MECLFKETSGNRHPGTIICLKTDKCFSLKIAAKKCDNRISDYATFLKSRKMLDVDLLIEVVREL